MEFIWLEVFMLVRRWCGTFHLIGFGASDLARLIEGSGFPILFVFDIFADFLDFPVIASNGDGRDTEIPVFAFFQSLPLCFATGIGDAS